MNATRITPNASHRRVFRSGFSLIELLVVVGIIVIILGLGVVVGSQMLRGADEDATRGLLGKVLTLATEVQAVSGRPGPFQGTMEQLVLEAKNHDSSRRMLLALGTDHLTGSDANGLPTRIVDSWGNNIHYRHTQDDLALPKYNEWDRPFAASWGPDGQKGDVRSSASETNQRRAQDNIYSFDRL